jgi:hypothetical protein
MQTTSLPRTHRPVDPAIKRRVTLTRLLPQQRFIGGAVWEAIGASSITFSPQRIDA